MIAQQAVIAELERQGIRLAVGRVLAGVIIAEFYARIFFRNSVNGGYLIPPTFMKRSKEEAMKLAKVVIKPETSEKMRYLMRLNAEKGTATKADLWLLPDITTGRIDIGRRSDVVDHRQRSGAATAARDSHGLRSR